MKLPALAIVTAFARGIACGLNVKIAHFGSSSFVVGVLLFRAAASLVGGMALSLLVWELFVLTLVLQIGMLPLLVSAFHRVTFAGTFVNFAAVPLTGIIVPLGFLTLISGLLWPPLGKILAGALSLVTIGLLL